MKDDPMAIDHQTSGLQVIQGFHTLRIQTPPDRVGLMVGKSHPQVIGLVAWKIPVGKDISRTFEEPFVVSVLDLI